MIIVNADDWGRTVAETNAALSCHRNGRITSATAMAFMKDSERAAEIALDCGMSTGLHLNLTQPFSAASVPCKLAAHQARICEFMNSHKYAFLLYAPSLAKDFDYTYNAQADEFVRLYSRQPTHVDGHHHKHLCTNVLLGNVIPAGTKLRRGFFFWPGEKGPINRAYRSVIDRMLARRYQLADYFFALSQCLGQGRLAKVIELAQTNIVELMTHPANPREKDFLMSDDCLSTLGHLDRGTYCSI